MWRDDREQPGARRWAVITGDCRETMATLEADSVDSVVCDPPYELGFMGCELSGEYSAIARARIQAAADRADL